MFEFTTEVKINVIGSHDILGGGGIAKIKWVANIEAREFGIKCFGIYVPEQTILATITRYDEESDEEYNEDVTFTLKNVTVDDYMKGGNISHLQLIPNELEVYKNGFELKF